jgi:apolipoprotein N-acyltransferase
MDRAARGTGAPIRRTGEFARRGGLRRTGPFVAALATALLAALCQPPAGLWPLAFLVLAPLAAALETRGPAAAFALSLAALLAFGVAGAGWLLHALVVEYGVALAPAALFAAVLFAFYAAVSAAPLAGAAALRPRVGLAGAPVAIAAAWIFGEWLRSEPLATPWLLLGHALAPVPLWLQTADLGGAGAVGFVPALVGAGLGVALARGSARPLLVPALVASAALGYGTLRLASPPTAGALRVGVVQASIPPSERFQPGSAARNTALHVVRTRQLVAERPVDLIVWSETAVDDDLDTQPALGRLLAGLADETGAFLVTGAPRTRAGRFENAVVLFAPGRGLVESYAKQRLVPFSESDPWWGAPLVPLVRKVAAGPPYVAGEEATVFRAAGVPFAAPICFEITYPRLMRRFRADGAALVVNVSNDAWFGRTGYAEMHLRHAVLRAVELRTWVVRGANTGISAVIDPQGRVRERLDLFADGALHAEVGRAERLTFYARAGDAPILAALGLGVALASRLGRRGRRSA